MGRILIGLIGSRARALAQRIAIPTLSILIAASFFLIALCALCIAFFLYLTPMLGPIGSALGVAAVTLILGALALLPLRRRRRAPPPPAAAAPTGVDFATLLPLISKMVKLRPLVLGALLVAIAVTLTSRSDDEDSSA
jgi:hypothetical protein